MTNIQQPASRKPLRLWPGVLFAILFLLLRYVLFYIAPEDVEVFSTPLPIVFLFAGLFCAIGILVWWIFFSRAAWLERLAPVALIAIAEIVLLPIVHESIRGGMMGMMLPVGSIPLFCVALVIGAVMTRRLAPTARLAGLIAVIVVASIPWLLIRSAGVMGTGGQFHWRWTPTPEQRLLAQGQDEPAKTERDVPRAETPPKSERDLERVEWPGFRGPRRDSVIGGLRIKTDWSASPPVQLWRRPIGPGWSSFAVWGDLIYTQEQRGDQEVVSCYRLSTGEPVWRHRDAVRFYESNGGPGPRGTPAVHDGRVYTLGATGIVNALNARTGAVVWSRNAKNDTGAPLPGWGFAGSPLVVNDVVIVAASGRLVGYDAATGKPRWTHTTGAGGYSSPHLLTIGGVPQIVLLSGGGATGVSPADGKRLWQQPSEANAVSMVQPAVTAEGDILIHTADAMGGQGLRRVAVAHGAAGWTVQERWLSRGLKPNFNDFVVHNGHAYGFDGSILSCIDIASGDRKWKGGRYGAGQMLLLSDQDVLLVVSEEGELALVAAAPDQFKELARFKAIEGKTWNHPTIAGDVLLLRNGEEMAAFRLPREAR